jgi:hypothetical protein
MKLDNVVLYRDINLMHVFYILKQVLDARGIVAANQFQPVPYFAGFVFMILIGEGGGIFPRIIFGRSSAFLSEDYKIWILLLTWY